MRGCRSTTCTGRRRWWWRSRAGKKGESWRVGLADGRILPLSIDNAAAQRKLALYDVDPRARGREGRGKSGGARRAAGAPHGAGHGGGPGEQDRAHPRDGGRLLLSAEPAQSRHPGRAPAGLRDQAAELSRRAGQGLAAQHADRGRADHAAAHRRPALATSRLLDAEELRRQLRRHLDLAPRAGELTQSGHRAPSRRRHREHAGSKSQAAVRSRAGGPDLSRVRALLSVRARRPAGAADRSCRILCGDRERGDTARPLCGGIHRARRRSHLPPPTHHAFRSIPSTMPPSISSRA